MASISKLRHCAGAPKNWLGHSLSNTWGVANVFDLTWLRPTPGGLLASDHPFITGKALDDGEPIWPRNLLFRSRASQLPLEADLQIVVAVMNYMRNMTALSSSQPDRPHGNRTRMPPAVNYIHGPVHYNGVTMLFDDVGDVVRHFTDCRFTAEVRRFIAEQQREITLILRDRDYDRDELATLACFTKTVLPYWANPNGNKRRVHWGVPAPYPNINLITGAWIGDTRLLLTAAGRARVARSPIPRGRYFTGEYGTGWSEFLWPEIWLSRLTTRRVLVRGEKGGMYFTDARKLKEGFLYDPEHLPRLHERIIERARDGFRRRVARVFDPKTKAPPTPHREEAAS